MPDPGPSSGDTVVPPTASLIVVDGFLPPELALEMRRDIDTHFSAPEQHRADTHQVWNYWFVPDSYTYLRTAPEKVIAPGRIEIFHNSLRNWSIAMLGMANVTWPYLSLYVGGCRQNWHNDSVNGSMDPVEGRFVLHGHLSEGGAIVEGALPVDMISGPVLELLRRIGEEWSAEVALYNGPLILRLTIAAGGAIAACRVMVDRVI